LKLCSTEHSTLSPEGRNFAMDQNIIPVTELKPGQTATIAGIQGGMGMVRRLSSLGIFEGRSITKVSGQWMRGPVIVRTGSTDVAVGYGMARRILVCLPEQAPQ
jgi:ferrous iron transport protein A